MSEVEGVGTVAGVGENVSVGDDAARKGAASVIRAKLNTRTKNVMEPDRCGLGEQIIRCQRDSDSPSLQSRS
jgi:hypothetical protein